MLQNFIKLVSSDVSGGAIICDFLTFDAFKVTYALSIRQRSTHPALHAFGLAATRVTCISHVIRL
jgi:hypothetical protein